MMIEINETSVKDVVKQIFNNKRVDYLIFRWFDEHNCESDDRDGYAEDAESAICKQFNIAKEDVKCDFSLFGTTITVKCMYEGQKSKLVLTDKFGPRDYKVEALS